MLYSNQKARVWHGLKLSYSLDARRLQKHIHRISGKATFIYRGAMAPGYINVAQPLGTRGTFCLMVSQVIFDNTA